MKETNYLTIHKDRKYGDFDFGVLSAVRDLTREEYNDLRLTLITAIGVMENMYRDSNSPKASQELTPTSNTKEIEI